MAPLTFRIIDSRHKHVPLWLGVLRWSIFASIVFAPGLLVESDAMQWAGFVVILGGVQIAVLGSTSEELTIEQARLRLDEIEAKTST
ncbi:hypothetical protein PhaeoP75_02278 [Phaeobacter gallaeciensis]|uniref:Uncharacterized protein n=1 Tax=Phaeobacter gallaeciensis TaxID=60890 RepID=A0AAC9Z9Z6_9RHOB|nr:hypothetical protein Gal_02237 [Phaeobacter gallaeciensis DSM 26640]ATE93248.1 hypothetical protein PhaeoP11_02228 [Phaeobacter gallaeciensis]ATE96930.1 hypothetical protein PhaeoP73_01618 [Phaeobacter gallaeciensis]ATF01913.1 hypothetical protein PhaeoP75_02278 [Phaeobacter gallaeciensis]ATF06293.1 hypothetical protein PhaeoP63_02227 [Phaeobacter gallaeciensis]